LSLAFPLARKLGSVIPPSLIYNFGPASVSGWQDCGWNGREFGKIGVGNIVNIPIECLNATVNQGNKAFMKTGPHNFIPKNKLYDTQITLSDLSV